MKMRDRLALAAMVALSAAIAACGGHSTTAVLSSNDGSGFEDSPAETGDDTAADVSPDATAGATGDGGLLAQDGSSPEDAVVEGASPVSGDANEDGTIGEGSESSNLSEASLGEDGLGEGAVSDSASSDGTMSEGESNEGAVDATSADAAGDSGGSADSGNASDGGGGACGGCHGGQMCVNGTCECPIYESFCGGICIPTSTDPNNCGGCNAQCTGTTACSGGVCSTSCLPGLTACNHVCVDTTGDSNNCGVCNHACPSGQGCVNGTCQPATVVSAPPGRCAGGGPPIGVPIGGATSCTGNLAQTTFTWALCSCTNVKISQTFLSDAYDSTQGPYAAPPHGLGGGVGLNGSLQISSTTDIYGTLWCSAANGGIATSTPTHVYQELHSGGPVSSGVFTVGSDAYVNGNISGGPAAIAGTLYQPVGDTVGGATYGQLVHQPVSVPQPCCDSSQMIPVGAIVSNAASANDDTAAGIAPTLLSGAGSPQRLDLPCGNYYFSEVKPGHQLTIAAHGHTAIYIAGDITASNPLTITVDAGESLDVFVAGTINTSQTLTLGSPNWPALMRVYVGGSTKLAFSQVTRIAANFYAAYAYVQWSAPVEVYGAVYANFFDSSQVTKIHYDRATLLDGQECASATPPDAGGPQCGSCSDCGNQACVNGACGKCSDDSQCCAPLLCDNGQCILVH